MYLFLALRKWSSVSSANKVSHSLTNAIASDKLASLKWRGGRRPSWTLSSGSFPATRIRSRSASSSAPTATASSTPRRRSAATRTRISTSAPSPSAAGRSPPPCARTGRLRWPPGPPPLPPRGPAVLGLSTSLLEVTLAERGCGKCSKPFCRQSNRLACCCATRRARRRSTASSATASWTWASGYDVGCFSSTSCFSLAWLIRSLYARSRIYVLRLYITVYSIKLSRRFTGVSCIHIFISWQRNKDDWPLYGSGWLVVQLHVMSSFWVGRWIFSVVYFLGLCVGFGGVLKFQALSHAC